MNGFISNILSRHTNTVSNIHPRLPGIFEPRHSQFAFSPRTEAEPELPQQIFTREVAKNITSPEFQTNTANPEHPNIPAPSQKSFGQNIQDKPGESGLENVKTRSTENSIEPFTENHPSFNPSLSEIIKPVFENNLPGKKIDPVNSDRSTVDLHSSLQDLSNISEPGSYQLNDDADEAMVKSHVVSLNMSEPIPSKESNVLDRKQAAVVNIIRPFFPKHSLHDRNFDAPITSHTERPVIKVSIGRIIVKAVSAPAPEKIKRSPTPQPKMSLDEYLKKRNSAE